MSDKYILDANGQPVPADLMTWARFFENREARRLASDEQGDIRVSTVFLGLNHAYDDGPPVLWETMIFGGPEDGYQDRYSSRDDALAGHAKAVALAFAPPADRDQG